MKVVLDVELNPTACMWSPETKATVSKKPGLFLTSLRINSFTSEFFRSYSGTPASKPPSYSEGGEARGPSGQYFAVLNRQLLSLLLDTSFAGQSSCITFYACAVI